MSDSTYETFRVLIQGKIYSQEQCGWINDLKKWFKIDAIEIFARVVDQYHRWSSR